LSALSTPLRDRFDVQLAVERCSADELTALVRREWDRAELAYEDDAAGYVADRSMGMLWRAQCFALTAGALFGEQPLTADLLCTLLDYLEGELREADWLQQDWDTGGSTAVYGMSFSRPRFR